jgi:hypothetical protein
MKTSPSLLPIVCALGLVALTSCTTVVDPAPVATTTTVHSEQRVTRPAQATTTTTRTTGATY